jgi:hypothetical protein
MFQTCVLNQNISRKGNIVTFLKLFINTMIKNIKLHKILDMVKVSKSMQPNKCAHKKCF